MTSSDAVKSMFHDSLYLSLLLVDLKLWYIMMPWQECIECSISMRVAVSAAARRYACFLMCFLYRTQPSYITISDGTPIKTIHTHQFRKTTKLPLWTHIRLSISGQIVIIRTHQLKIISISERLWPVSRKEKKPRLRPGKTNRKRTPETIKKTKDPKSKNRGILSGVSWVPHRVCLRLFKDLYIWSKSGPTSNN